MTVFWQPFYKDNPNDPCSICWDNFEDEQAIVYHDYVFDNTTEKIQHVFHKNCISDWVNNGHITCPLCFRPIEDPQNLFPEIRYKKIFNQIKKLMFTTSLGISYGFFSHRVARYSFLQMNSFLEKLLPNVVVINNQNTTLLKFFEISTFFFITSTSLVTKQLTNFYSFNFLNNYLRYNLFIYLTGFLLATTNFAGMYNPNFFSRYIYKCFARFTSSLPLI